ncbi:helix-turn-helix domain-containing protein [Nostoc sp. CCY0012]|uniref:helix-turn-helix domain-containing protein n=1 Tax=Nostoc sp. CCY0012 TaxID=1056123 RepID=UPI0039C62411
MTLIFNPDKYKELLIKHQPKLIKNEADNEKALAIVEELMYIQNRSPEENELYELLITLIEKFEQEFYAPGRESTPHSMLLFLMEEKNVQQSDLVNVFDSHDILLEIINGQREISKSQAQALGNFFHVDPSVFIAD